MSTVKYERLEETRDVISWAEEHGAEPAKREMPGGGIQLTFNTDGNRDGTPMEWNEFLRQFRREGLSLLVEPDDSSSHYFKLVRGEPEKDTIQIGMTRGDQLGKQDQNRDFRAK
jgi:hypothetical protein